jgi:hypothetical protein
VCIYCSPNVFVNCLHSWSYLDGPNQVLLWCLIINAMSILKSPSNIEMPLRLAFICCVMVVCINSIKSMSSRYDDIYMCSSMWVCKGWIFICIICRYKDILGGLGF